MTRKREPWQRDADDGLRTKLGGQPSDDRGTSPNALGRVRRESEKARYTVCPDCGYGAGRPGQA